MGCTQAKIQQDTSIDNEINKKSAVSNDCLKANHEFERRPSANSKTKSHLVKFTLTKEEKVIIQKYWENTVLVQIPDLFLRTMLNSIKESPKLLDVINCRMGDPNIPELSEWPKLKCMAKGNCNFFTKQIVENHLEESLVRKDSEVLGAIHIQYSPYGFKPTFLDIWHNNILKLIREEVNFDCENSKEKFLSAFTKLAHFLITILIVEYEDHMKSVRLHDREVSRSQNDGISPCPADF
ncbi:Globin, structural domain-containing protein [Strongyloides ratti]|uniref:Globin, structural domain-containing protein n=1 Tax=Strongyloides ratti TaxID=34506 RepID=A0A090MU83_STRRB|nr:Globin, structural domain-containing protein [Strongyloides ratti]CEF62058.1 Globin, structural domain-containing protein [Strongyloides ratti]